MLDYYEITIYFSSFNLSSLDYEICKKIWFTVYIVKEETLRFVNLIASLKSKTRIYKNNFLTQIMWC